MTEALSPGWRDPNYPDRPRVEGGAKRMRAMTAGDTRARRRTEQRELRLYYAVAFCLCFPVVAMARFTAAVKGKEVGTREGLIAETNSKVSAMLGFGFMA